MPHQKDLLLAEGKTKRIWSSSLTNKHVIIESKDDLTAGDGAKHDIIPGKGALSNQTICNVFECLKAWGLPVAFFRQYSATEFIAEHCAMIPYEVVVRRLAFGSILKRYPSYDKGYVFPELLPEFFLKTSGKKWQGYGLPVDDPLIIFSQNRGCLFRPDQPIGQQAPFLILDDFPLQHSPKEIKDIDQIAIRAFLEVEIAWRKLGYRLVDFKLEFGHNVDGELRLADVIDNDSWRLLDEHGYDVSKQAYREGEPLEKVAANYRLVAQRTELFCI